MENITLEESKKIKLFKRFESKYIIPNNLIYNIYNYCENNYLIVENNKIFYFPYYSLYFDNDKLDMIKAHENNDLIRQKLRIREYYNGDKFLEIKEKNNYQTNKIRIPVISYEINNEKNWISSNLIYDTKNLSKTLEVKYNRITLLSKDKSNRITFDFDINFKNYKTNKEYKIDHNIIIEVKKNSEENIDIEDYLNSLEIFKEKFSKYYYGMKKTSEN